MSGVMITGSATRRRQTPRGVRLIATAVAALLLGGAATTAAYAAAPLDPSEAGGLIGTQKNAVAPRECPADQVVIGARAQNRGPGNGSSGILVQFDLLCGSISLDETGAPQVTAAPEWTTFPQYDQGLGNTSDGVCPTNQVAHQMSGSTFQSTARWPQSVILHCRPLTVTGDGDLRVDRGAAETLVTAGDGTVNPTQQRVEGPYCATDEPTLSTVVIRGYRPQGGGEGLDGYAPSCGRFGTDRGDAPASYGEASHPVNAGTFLGATVDSERASQPSADAGGDDLVAGVDPDAAIDDEDGVAGFAPVRVVEGTPYTVQVVATNRVSGFPATLSAWIDFNLNGTFEADESATATVPAGSTAQSVPLTWAGLEQRVPASGASFARVRLAVGGDPAAVSATGEARAGEVEDYPVQLVAAEPALSLVKTVADIEDASGDGVTNAGDILTYDLTVTNTGPVTMRDVAVADPLPGLSAPAAGTWPGDTGVLRPAESVTFRARYTVTQADVERGSVLNTASASGIPPIGARVFAPDASTTTPLDRTASLSLVKRASLTDPDASAGDLVDYTFTVANTGSVMITDTTLIDPKPGLGDITYGAWPETEGVLAPGQTVTASARYALTQADIDAGVVQNTATATGVSVAGPVTPGEGSVSLPLSTRSEITLDKTALVESASTPRVGDRVTYRFDIGNSGTTTARDIGIVDPLPGLSQITFEAESGATDAAPTLAPGEHVIATATYVFTQADIDAGSVSNTATAQAVDPSGAPVPGATDTALVDLDSLAVLAIEKKAAFTGGSSATPGESVEYSFTVTNLGNVTVRDVQIDDRLPRLSLITFGAWPTAQGSLAPGETVTATANYAVTDADIQAHGVSNTATATGTTSAGPITSDPSVAIVPLAAEQPVALARTGVDPATLGTSALGLWAFAMTAWMLRRRRPARD